MSIIRTPKLARIIWKIPVFMDTSKNRRQGEKYGMSFAGITAGDCRAALGRTAE